MSGPHRILVVTTSDHIVVRKELRAGNTVNGITLSTIRYMPGHFFGCYYVNHEEAHFRLDRQQTDIQTEPIA